MANPTQNKKKILFVITKSVWGGAGKYVYDLARNLPRDRFEVHVAAGGEGSLTRKLREKGVFCHNIYNFQRDINVMKEICAYFELLKLFLKIRPDIIHTNSSKAAGLAGSAAWDYELIGFKFGVKKIFTAHGWAFHESRPLWQKFIIRFLSRLTCVYYDKIICVSEYDRLSAIRHSIVPKKKLITIHNGINPTNCEFADRNSARAFLSQKIKKNITENDILIGVVGEYVKNKGQEFLIDAVANLKNENFGLKAVLIGWGEKKEKLEDKITKIGMKNEIFIVEGLYPASPYFKAFDIFALPSLKEGLPYVLLEAGLAGLPVVASKIGGIPEIIEDGKTGFLAKPGNAASLSQAIKQIAQNRKMADGIAENLYKKITDDFSFDKMLDKTLSAYK